MEVIKISHYNKLTLEYENLIKTLWTNDFKEDFHWEHFSNKKNINESDIIIAQEDWIFLWWAIVSTDIFVNKFSSKNKVKHKMHLQERWYKSLVYLIISPSHRWKNLGSKILSYLLENYEKIWLSYEPWTIPFYEKWWFKHYLDPSSNEVTGIMINK
jgi:GNAT superfamily N-acetyltransferase